MKFAQENNLEVSKNIAFGFYKGYFITLGGRGVNKYASVDIHEGDETTLDELRGYFGTAFEKKGVITGCTVVPQYVTLNYTEGAKKSDITEAVLAFIISKLTEKNIHGAGFCPHCGQPLESGERVKIRGNVYIMHRECVEELVSQVQSKENKADETGSTGLGLIGALLGGIAGSIPWTFVSYFGWFSAWLGFLIAICASKGYDMFKGKQSRAKIAIVAVSTVVGVLFAEIATVTFDIIDQYQMGLGEALDLFVQNLLFNPEFVRAIIGEVLFGLLFAVLGMIGVIKNIKDSLPVSSMPERV